MIPFEKHIYKNGLRLITAPLEGTEAVTCLVLVGTGSRYESDNIAGISHFLEHMFFKGAERYKNTKEVSEAIDSVGGDFNAFTGKEYTGYYIKVAKQHLTLSLDILSDMMLNASLPEKEAEKERGVIIEEINMYEDTPMIKVEEDFEELMFGKHPLGRSIAGTKQTVSATTREALQKYRQTHYRAGNIVIAISGALNQDTIQDLVARYFAFEEEPFEHKYQKYSAQARPLLKLIEKDTEQAHLILGVPACSSAENAKYPSKLLATILGGSMSSRMFMKIREEKSLCYYVSSSTDHYLDTGLFTTRAGVDLTRIEDAVQAIKDEYLLAAQEGFTEQELQKAKDYIRGKTVLRLEDSEALASLLAMQELLYNELLSPEELLAKYDEISLKEVNALAQKLFQKDLLHLTLIAPKRDAGELERILKS
ncbi:MAG: pitrilysin family protein [Candidatus Gracilibacteria bacterium]|nr:pitrilysin family protein [Candidatus Gracilibacteria bacterium]